MLTNPISAALGREEGRAEERFRLCRGGNASRRMTSLGSLEINIQVRNVMGGKGRVFTTHLRGVVVVAKYHGH